MIKELFSVGWPCKSKLWQYGMDHTIDFMIFNGRVVVIITQRITQVVEEILCLSGESNDRSISCLEKLD